MTKQIYQRLNALYNGLVDAKNISKDLIKIKDYNDTDIQFAKRQIGKVTQELSDMWNEYNIVGQAVKHMLGSLPVNLETK